MLQLDAPQHDQRHEQFTVPPVAVPAFAALLTPAACSRCLMWRLGLVMANSCCWICCARARLPWRAAVTNCFMRLMKRLPRFGAQPRDTGLFRPLPSGCGSFSDDLAAAGVGPAAETVLHDIAKAVTHSSRAIAGFKPAIFSLCTCVAPPQPVLSSEVDWS